MLYFLNKHYGLALATCQLQENLLILNASWIKFVFFFTNRFLAVTNQLAEILSFKII